MKNGSSVETEGAWMRIVFSSLLPINI